jgi:uncharacterized protein (DUF885 family)
VHIVSRSRAGWSVACAAAALLGAVAAHAAAPAPSSTPAWVQKSNQHAQVLMDVMAKFGPEGAAFLGVPGYDEAITDLSPGFEERADAATAAAKAELEKRLAAETDVQVRQDLEILIRAADEQIRGNQLSRKYDLPYFSVSRMTFQGLRALLDDQVDAKRRAAAVVRLRRYTGQEKGYQPIAELAEQHIRGRMNGKLRTPFKDEVEKDLANSARFMDGVGKLFAKYKLKGYEKPYAALKTQVAAYEAFVRQEILPNARTDFRQPEELYAFSLEQLGVDMPLAELQSRAKTAFQETQRQMQALAPRVAAEKGWKLADYRDVIRELKKSQLVGDDILAHYQARAREVEEIIRREAIVTVPAREMKIELASEAESANTPAPNMRPPRLIGNTGEMGTFVLPLRIPGKPGEEEKQFDDFTIEAASWTLCAHEGRPGHELQFSALVESGVSLARAIFAFNSVNVEGWGLYAEAEMVPYEPLEGQLMALQHRLLRNARAYLDPGLQLGTISRDEGYRILREDVVLSDAMATQEVERYMFWAPGQATSYFVGYSRLLEIRQDAELALGKAFDRKRFNDFVLSQGMVPPSLLRRAVMEQFVPSVGQSTAN